MSWDFLCHQHFRPELLFKAYHIIKLETILWDANMLGKCKQHPFFSENWPETQRKDGYIHHSKLIQRWVSSSKLARSHMIILFKNVANTHTKATYLFYCHSVCSTNLLRVYSLCIVHAQQRCFPLMWKNFKELNDLQKCIVLTLQWPTFYPVLTD